MNEFWNERYADEAYAYGTEPNQFFKQKLEKLTAGKILLPAEGEGRNAVFAAKLGWEVTAFDNSSTGKEKAEKLALTNKVQIDYQLDSYEDIQFKTGEFDALGFIFAHIHSLKRNEYHKKLASWLKPGGILILEGFSKKQIHNNTGGPQNIDMLFSKAELQTDFGDFTSLSITETDIVIDEGKFHQGKASVIRIYGVK